MNEIDSSRHRGVTAGGDGEGRPRLAEADRGRTDRSTSLDLFHDRCCTLAERVSAGGISFIDAVDLAYSAAQFSGLADRVGDDAVQAVMGSAFMGCHS
jgi:hypothetical protein